MAGKLPLRAESLTADAPFSYTCHRCRRCCHGKLIQVNPYEIARLARATGLSTTDFIRAHLEPERPYLRRRDDEACVFLGPDGCTVHADRPLVCRLYPVGRHVVAGSGEDSVRYSIVEGHAESAGVFGTAGTIAGFLQGQQVEAFSDAASAYLAALQALFDAWRRTDDDVAPDSSADDRPEAMDVLDMDRAVAAHCAERGIPEPTELADRMHLHLDLLHAWAGSDSD